MVSPPLFHLAAFIPGAWVDRMTKIAAAATKDPNCGVPADPQAVLLDAIDQGLRYFEESLNIET